MKYIQCHICGSYNSFRKNSFDVAEKLSLGNTFDSMQKMHQGEWSRTDWVPLLYPWNTRNPKAYKYMYCVFYESLCNHHHYEATVNSEVNSIYDVIGDISPPLCEMEQIVPHFLKDKYNADFSCVWFGNYSIKCHLLTVRRFDWYEKGRNLRGVTVDVPHIFWDLKKLSPATLFWIQGYTGFIE